ncbi:pectate lyase-like adhesive domain-containing protein [Enterococcus larvae]|uniref:pectate lyase-like adhesive domain-containing protein n=1 Tax=Enterococcus larvae TaxID=2794352 RepID=UPI003F3D89E1
MKKTKKIRLFWVNVLMVAVLCGAVFTQLYGNLSTLFAKTPLSISMVDEAKVTEHQKFIVELSDERDVKELGNTLESDPREIVTFDSSSASEDSGADEAVEAKREWRLTVPEGLTFDETEENAMLLEEDGDAELPIFNWNENERILTISAASEQTTLRLILTAEKSGDHQISFSSGDEKENAAELTVTVVKSDSSDLETENSAVVQKQTRSLRAVGTAEVTDWQTFAEALADSSITTISLSNDIKLTGTINNYASLFDKDSVDLDAGYGYLFVSKAAISRGLVIEGNGYTFDFGNLAIGFVNAATNTSSYWNITLQNITVKSNNPYAPFYYPVLPRAVSGMGMTSYLSNSKLTYGDNYTHIKSVNDMITFFLAYANRSVTEINFANDIVFPAGTTSLNYQLPNINNAATNIFSATSMSNASGGTTFLYTNISGAARAVTVEGNGYSIDFGTVTLCVYDVTLNDGSGYNLRWYQTYQNVNFFHGNYWGPIEIQDLSDTYERQCWQRFVDVTDYGAQFVQAEASTLYFGGNIHLEQQEYYRSVGKDGNPLRSDGTNYNGSTDSSYWRVNNSNNQTIGVSNATFEDNATIFLSSIGGVVVDLYSGGNMVIGKNVQMDAVRNGPSNSGDGTGAVLSLRGGSITVGDDSVVNLTSNHSSQPAVISLNSSSAAIDIGNGAEVNLSQTANSSNGNGNTQNAIYMSGGSINVNGALNIKGTNMASSNSHMIYSTSNVSFVIGKEGTLDIQSDSTSIDQRLIYMGGSSSTFKFSDAERVNLQRVSALTSGTSTNNGLIYSGGNLEVSVQNVFQWTLNNMNGGTTADTGHDFDYVPMSSMVLRYGGGYNPTITSANSMTSATLNSFNQNFTTRGQQRVLFTRIPDPSVSINSISNDNPDDPGSYTIYGYAVPGAYIRLWEEALNGTTSAKEKGVNDTVASPVEDTGMAQETRDNFTVQADSNGDWSYTVSSGNYFTAGNIIHAYGFSNLKSEEPTQLVLDKTPPTATPVTYYISQGESLPDPSAFVKDVADTSPVNTGFDYAFTDPAEAESQRNTVGTHTIKINVSDQATDADGNAAPNTAVIEATLIVLESASGITANDLEVPYVDIRSLTDEQLAAYILANSDPSAFTTVSGVLKDLTDYIEVTDFGGLNNYSSLQPNTPYVVTLTVPANATTGLSTEISTTINVVVINMDAVLTVEFEDESGTVLSGYTITIGEGQDIDTALNVGDVIDLTSSAFQAVQDQLAALETAGYEISIRPTDETSLTITETEQTVTYTVTGQLFLKSAPLKVDFGNITYNAKVQRVDNPTTDGDLVVTDTRANKSDGWTLYAALTTNMTNASTGSVMNEALWYVNGNGDEIPLTLDYGNQTIYTNSSGGTFDVTSTWGSTSEDPGLKLIADPTKTTVSSVGTYAGVVTWTIMAGQP